MVLARSEINNYANQVLNVVKAKFNLNDKSEALNKLAEIYGDEFVDKEANEEYTKKIIDICDRHMEKYPKRRMTLKELDKLCGVWYL